jgi:3-methyladenine DNA glycosylase/8-oxoguanine DNA glycosylase
VILDLTVRPPWPSEPPRAAGPSGLAEIKGGVVRRATRVDGEIALAEAAWRGDDVLLRAHADSEEVARETLRRMRFVLALDDDLEPFHRAYRSDPLLGRVIRARPKLRVLRKPEPFEALAWAVIEQLIDTQAAGNIAWTLTRRHGERHPAGPWCAPTPAKLANAAALEAAGLAPTQSRTLARVARAVADGQIDPASEDQRRLEAIPGVGEWTLAHLNLFGRGRYDVPLAGDVGMRNCYARVAGVRTGSVTEPEFAAVLERYKPWQGLAAMYLVAAGWRSGARWSQSPHDLRRR